MSSIRSRTAIRRLETPIPYHNLSSGNCLSTTGHSTRCASAGRTAAACVRADGKWKKLAGPDRRMRSIPGQMTVANSVGQPYSPFRGGDVQGCRGQRHPRALRAAQVVPNLLGGHVDTLVQLPGALPAHVDSARCAWLAVLTQNATRAMPDVPPPWNKGYKISLEALARHRRTQRHAKPVIARSKPPSAARWKVLIHRSSEKLFFAPGIPARGGVRRNESPKRTWNRPASCRRWA